MKSSPWFSDVSQALHEIVNNIKTSPLDISVSEFVWLGVHLDCFDLFIPPVPLIFAFSLKHGSLLLV